MKEPSLVDEPSIRHRARAVDANRAADAIRKRWRIENKSHHRRGVQRLGDPPA